MLTFDKLKEGMIVKMIPRTGAGCLRTAVVETVAENGAVVRTKNKKRGRTVLVSPKNWDLVYADASYDTANPPTQKPPIVAQSAPATLHRDFTVIEERLGAISESVLMLAELMEKVVATIQDMQIQRVIVRPKDTRDSPSYPTRDPMSSS